MNVELLIFILALPVLAMFAFCLFSILIIGFKRIQSGLVKGKFYHWLWNNFRFIRKVNWNGI